MPDARPLALALAMTVDEPAEYWTVNNHQPDCQPAGRPEIHADWTAARGSLAGDMASWAAFVDDLADCVHRGEDRPTMTERVDQFLGNVLAGLQPGSDLTVTFADEATSLQRTFTLQPMAAIPRLDAAQARTRSSPPTG